MVSSNQPIISPRRPVPAIGDWPTERPSLARPIVATVKVEVFVKRGSGLIFNQLQDCVHGILPVVVDDGRVVRVGVVRPGDFQETAERVELVLC